VSVSVSVSVGVRNAGRDRIFNNLCFFLSAWDLERLPFKSINSHRSGTMKGPLQKTTNRLGGVKSDSDS
jgi:hypothetical protein